MLDSRQRGQGFKPHWRHCVVSLSKNINHSLVLVQPMKTCPYITERLLMVRKESNQTNKTCNAIQNSYFSIKHSTMFIRALQCWPVLRSRLIRVNTICHSQEQADQDLHCLDQGLQCWPVPNRRLSRVNFVCHSQEQADQDLDPHLN